MKALLLRVGIDMDYGGTLSPIFEDNSFLFIPIPHEDVETKETRTFDTLEVGGEKIRKYLPKKLKRPDWDSKKSLNICKPHDDPEFRTFTYGDLESNRRGEAVNKLKKGDYLIFFAGFKDKNNDKKYGIIGYFLVNKIYTNFSEEVREILKENSHIKNKEIENKLIIVKGDEKQSKLLKKTYIISEKSKNKIGRLMYITSKEFSNLTGIPQKQITRGFKWIKDEGKLKNLLKKLEQYC